MDVGFRTLRMRVHVRCLYECTGRMLIRIWCILDVDSTVQQRLGGYGAESWIFYQTVTRPPWFSKSKLYGHTWNIYNFASYLWFKKSQYNREAVLNRSTSYPPCITAIETSHKQKEDVYNGTTNDFPSIHLPSAVGSLKVDNLHTTVFDISPRKYISQVFFSRCGKSRIKQQRIFYWWILCQRLNSLPNRSSSFMFKKFIAAHASEFRPAWDEQNGLATQSNQIACSKSNSLLFLSISSKIPSIQILL